MASTTIGLNDNDQTIFKQWGASTEIYEEFFDELKNKQSLWLQIKTSKPVLFWSLVLREMNPHEDIRRLILSALVSPVSSAEAERSFAWVNRIKTKDRTRMDLPLLNALMHVNMNGPPLDSLDVESYTKKYIEEGGRLCKLGETGNSGDETTSLQNDEEIQEASGAEPISLLFNSV